MNTMSVHDISSNEDVLPDSTSYGNNSYGYVQVLYHNHLKISGVVDVEVFNGAYITKMHLENLQNNGCFRSHTNALCSRGQFLKMNTNQLVDLEHNQIMKCVIICHNDFVGLEILAMHIGCKKGLITYTISLMALQL
jgi:hypothetical protein